MTPEEKEKIKRAIERLADKIESLVETTVYQIIIDKEEDDDDEISSFNPAVNYEEDDD